MAEVACLGILVADLIGRPIDDLPERGRLSLVEHMTLHIGGCAANTGIDLVRLGIETAVMGKVGEDGLGDFVVSALESGGVETTGVVRDGAASTSATMVLVGADGERTFLHHLGGNARYTAEDVTWPVVKGARILHVAGALVMPAIDGQPMANVLRSARSEGVATSLDTVWDATGRWMTTLRPCLEHIDYFTPSLSEAQALMGLTDPSEVAQALRDSGVRTVGLKLGHEGCLIVSDRGQVRAPIFAVDAIDGTGSGDAWDAGFLVGVLRGWDIERTARFANAVGALCVTAVGATAGVRSFDETEAFIRGYGG